MELNQKELNEINQNIAKMVQNETMQVESKRSFCRYFLRGLCMYDNNDCKFSHGVSDLDYQKWNQDEIVEYEYLKDTAFCQKNTIKGPRIYKNLYDFQTKKVFTLDELNEDRAKRNIVRQEMHKKMFNEFIDLLEQKHPEALFSEDFLVREYTRVGFNKLMTRISFSQLSNYLCNEDDSSWFKLTTIMPPCLKKERTFIIRRIDDQSIDKFYKDTYYQILKDHSEETIDEGRIKKFMFSATRPSIFIPPLNLCLKSKKMSFSIYLKSLLGQNIAKTQIKFEADLPTLVQTASIFLQKQIAVQLVEWNDVYKHLAKQHQLNNGNIINQVKPFMVMEGYRFLFFPMTQFIVHPELSLKIQYENQQVCPCNFKQMYSEEELMIFKEGLSEQGYQQLEHKESYDIFDLESLILCAPNILKSKVLGVDLEGRLRKNGYIEMIQLNNGSNTFLIDIYRMDLNGDVETFELTKKVLRNVMMDKAILKIFHDCRHDSLALHQFMNTCIKNIYDTSAAQTYIGQLQSYQSINKLLSEKINQNQKGSEKIKKQKQQKAKEVIAQANNVKTPGLNEILKTYEAPHGINKNKDLFHGMWKKGQTSLFDERPLNPEYREYCIKDVLDLNHVYNKMAELDQGQLGFDLDLAKWISSQYVKNGYLGTEEGQEKK